jgi:hypothetical protein
LAVRRGVAGVLAALLLVLIVTSSLATVMVLTGRSMEHGRAALEESARRARDTATPPALSLEAAGGGLVATVISQSPAEVRWFVVERADGSVEVKPGGTVYGTARFALLNGYNCQPVRVYMMLSSGAVVAYDPRNDPLIARMPEGWDGWWKCGLADSEGNENRWRMIDPSRVQPVKASGGGGNDTMEHDIHVRANFVGNTATVDRVHRQAVPRLGGHVTVSLRGELFPLGFGESLLVLRVTGPSNNTFFTGDVSIYLRAKVSVSPPQGYSCDVVRVEIFPVVYTPNGVVTKIHTRVYNFWWQCYYEYEMRYRVSLVDSYVVTMAYTYTAQRHSDASIVVQDARYEVNVTLVKAKIVDAKPAVYSLGSPGWVRLQLSGYGVAHDPLEITLRWITNVPSLTFTTIKRYSIPPWVGFIWPGTVRETRTNFNQYTTRYDINYGGHPQVTVVLDAGGGLSKNFTLTPGNPLTLAYPGEVRLVVTPRPEPPFNDPYVHERADPAPMLAPWRAPAVILAEYADGRREIIVVSPTGRVMVGQGNLVFSGYGQLLGDLPFAYTPPGSRLAVFSIGSLDSLGVGRGSWLPQPVISATNAYRIIAVIPDDRFKAGYVIAWVN